ncbi:unnamed protein product [Penicillium olsonii]|uniref:3-phytase n=1 Tax=Penicillium olsonii TaxID=99116 RepID=A0A9W4MMS9_PENOL|nr:unnamed protein product [Penicillium olsonii]CAG7977101.1 unnamed protein product [Penicillium olsonii]
MAPLTTLLYALSITSALGSSVSESSKPFSQEFRDNYSVLKHYGGNGPYSERRSYGIDRDPPASCAVDQVIMIKRHGERYPSPSLGAGIEKTLSKLDPKTKYQGDLAFFNDWSYYVPNKCLYNAETSSGPYAGLLDGYTHGTEYRARYGHLWDGDAIVPMWSSGYGRVIETARKFGEGFFGYNYSTNAALNIISESESMGANSLTPVCYANRDSATCDGLSNTMPQFKVAAERLNAQNPGLDLNATDVYYLMSMASFELNARASSKWIDVFTQDEWVSFGYVHDLNYYYCAGPGDKSMSAVGSVYANASLTLLNEGPQKTNPLFFNFAHDTNITPILAALGLLTPEEDLPLDRIPFGNPYSTGDIVPQGGHFTIERLSCDKTAISDAGSYVRLVLNEAVVPFHQCTSGPGYSCPLEEYTTIVKGRLPDFVGQCKVPHKDPKSLNFWWKYNSTTELNYRNGSVPCQEAEAQR